MSAVSNGRMRKASCEQFIFVVPPYLISLFAFYRVIKSYNFHRLFKGSFLVKQLKQHMVAVHFHTFIISCFLTGSIIYHVLHAIKPSLAFIFICKSCIFFTKSRVLLRKLITVALDSGLEL